MNVATAKIGQSGAKVLWLSWKDRGHPQWGGAEVLTHELRTRLHSDGHAVTLLTCGYQGAPAREQAGGIHTIRVGANRYTHPFRAAAHYLLRLRNKFDFVIEEVNAAPYFSVLFGKKAKRFLFYHHLEREVWLHEAKPPLNFLGYYVIEPTVTHLLGRSRVPLITVSESTRREMAGYGFSPERTHVISEGIEIKPLANLRAAHKFSQPTILSFGSLRAMKRTLDQVQAFEHAKQFVPNLQLKIAGDASGPYGQAVLRYISRSPHKADIDYLGKVSLQDKIKLMRSCHIIIVTSVKEGWGLIVTEAASQGTPAVVYDVPGLRDSVRHQQTGLVTAAQPAALAEGIVQLLSDREMYQRLQRAAWQWSKQINFDQSYKDLKTALGIT
jgi:glycosyltransferase involved in cell wall biosynthesis